MNQIPYSFSVLRYVHDSVTQEFVNIGVAVYSPDAKFLRARCATHYARITRMFAKIDGNRFRQLTRYIEDRLSTIGQDLATKFPFEPGLAIEQVLAKVLPPDDSSVQFSPAGVGLSRDLGQTVADLFDRYVERYTGAVPRREDDDVWRNVYREALDRRDVTAYLTPKQIAAPNFEYRFEHAWKNKVWHLYEPVSFDLVESTSIVDKANRWLGRATTLSESKEPFQIHLLLGEPSNAELQPAFVKAQNILKKIPVKTELIRESDADSFAAELEKEVRKHEKAS